MLQRSSVTAPSKKSTYGRGFFPSYPWLTAPLPPPPPHQNNIMGG